MLANGLLRGAAETFGVVAAFLAGGLGIAGLEQRALARAGAYAPAAMSEPAPEPSGAEPAASARPVWLIDGYNVLCAGVLRGRERARFWSAPSRRQLLERVARFDAAGARVVVVFDGSEPPEEAPSEGVETVFAASADAWILDALRRGEVGAPTVVTADRQLAGRARHRGAEVVAPLAFLARCPG
jgi:hypothetical protein